MRLFNAWPTQRSSLSTSTLTATCSSLIATIHWPSKATWQKDSATLYERCGRRTRRPSRPSNCAGQSADTAPTSRGFSNKIRKSVNFIGHCIDTNCRRSCYWLFLHSRAKHNWQFVHKHESTFVLKQMFADMTG